jgi:hypothetical protein
VGGRLLRLGVDTLTYSAVTDADLMRRLKIIHYVFVRTVIDRFCVDLFRVERVSSSFESIEATTAIGATLTPSALLF